MKTKNQQIEKIEEILKEKEKALLEQELMEAESYSFMKDAFLLMPEDDLTYFLLKRSEKDLRKKTLSDYYYQHLKNHIQNNKKTDEYCERLEKGFMSIDNIENRLLFFDFIKQVKVLNPDNNYFDAYEKDYQEHKEWINMRKKTLDYIVELNNRKENHKFAKYIKESNYFSKSNFAKKERDIKDLIPKKNLAINNLSVEFIILSSFLITLFSLFVPISAFLSIPSYIYIIYKIKKKNSKILDNQVNFIKKHFSELIDIKKDKMTLISKDTKLISFEYK